MVELNNKCVKKTLKKTVENNADSYMILHYTYIKHHFKIFSPHVDVGSHIDFRYSVHVVTLARLVIMRTVPNMILSDFFIMVNIK